MLARFGLEGSELESPSNLSGGQQQRVAIARAFAARPRAMLLDEVTSALDPELVGEVLRAVRDLKEEGVTMLIATHEMGFAREVADKVGFLHEGRLVEVGPPEQVLEHPQDREHAEVPAAPARGRARVDNRATRRTARLAAIRAARLRRASSVESSNGQSDLEQGTSSVGVRHGRRERCHRGPLRPRRRSPGPRPAPPVVPAAGLPGAPEALEDALPRCPPEARDRGRGREARRYCRSRRRTTSIVPVGACATALPIRLLTT